MEVHGAGAFPFPSFYTGVNRFYPTNFTTTRQTVFVIADIDKMILKVWMRTVFD